jgi:organic radical activating enzyme
MDEKTLSFTAANSLPLKFALNAPLMECLSHYHIPPTHAQVIPTNKCNFSCSFCSCSERDKNLELSLDEVQGLAHTLSSLGCQAVTITGGGEPFMHPQLNAIIRIFLEHSIDVGLVTNGYLLDNLQEPVTWCRISCSDERQFTGKARLAIERAVRRFPQIGWAFSYVVSTHPQFYNLADYITFANAYKFTHVRVVSDLLDVEHIPDMSAIQSELQTKSIDDHLVIYQGRKLYVPGEKRCLISLLKPLIGADGMIYPCCGVQYAHSSPDLDTPSSMIMGHWTDLPLIISEQASFDGSNCVRCYYQEYNRMLNFLTSRIEHIPFV